MRILILLKKHEKLITHNVEKDEKLINNFILIPQVLSIAQLHKMVKTTGY